MLVSIYIHTISLWDLEIFPFCGKHKHTTHIEFFSSWRKIPHNLIILGAFYLHVLATFDLIRVEIILQRHYFLYSNLQTDYFWQGLSFYCHSPGKVARRYWYCIQVWCNLYFGDKIRLTISRRHILWLNPGNLYNALNLTFCGTFYLI